MMSLPALSVNYLRRIPLGYSRLAMFSRANSSFEAAVERLKSVKDADNQQKLKIYALYKQATVGKNTSPRPGMMELVKKAKHDAWSSLGDMSNEEAQKQYIDFVNELAGASETPGEAKEIDAGEGLKITVQDGIRTIFLNRPEKYNALTREMYLGIANALTEANIDDATKVVVLAGAGKLFCSGNDLGNFMEVTDVKKAAEDGHSRLKAYVAAYIDCKKPLIALVHGPAVGIAVTVLGLCDAVYASDAATFQSPFSSLGQSPEGCSSYTFPRIMGYARASELLFFNSKITAGQAKDWGLVSEVIPNDRFQEEAWKKVKQIAELPVRVWRKRLIS